MGQVNEATITMFKKLLAEGKHINSTHSEEEQLIWAWEQLHALRSTATDRDLKIAEAVRAECVKEWIGIGKLFIDVDLPSILAAIPPEPLLAQEVADVDKIIAKLGLTEDQARTECGFLNVPRILAHIEETIVALQQAQQFGAAMSDKYRSVQHAPEPVAVPERHGCRCGHDSDCAMHNSESPQDCDCSVRSKFEKRFKYLGVETGRDLDTNERIYVRPIAQGAWLGWNAMLAAAPAVKDSLTDQPAQALTSVLTEFLQREMPAGTLIADPTWWADRIARAIEDRVEGGYSRRSLTNSEVRAWIDRYDLNMDVSEARCAMNDARTIEATLKGGA